MSEGRCGCRRCDPSAWPESNGWVCEPQRKLQELEAALAAERKRAADFEATVREIKDAAKCDDYDALIVLLRQVADLERDRERLQSLVRDIVGTAQREPDPWEDTWTVRLSHDLMLELQALDAAREAKG